jgi:hypothetical protein
VSEGAPRLRFEGDLPLLQHGKPSTVAHVVVDERGLVIDHVLAASREQLFGGGIEQIYEGGDCRALIVAKQDRERPHLRWSFSPIDRATASAILQAAGIDADQRALHVRLTRQFQPPERLAALSIVAVLMILGVLSLPNADGIALVFLGFCFWIAANLATSATRLGHVDLLIGADGILRTRFRSRFVRFTQVRQVIRKGAYVGLRLINGRSIVLSVDSSASAEAAEIISGEAVADLIDLRVREGIERSAAAAKILRQDFSVARGANELRSWLSQLRVAHRGATEAYRSAPPPDVDLDALFDDGSLDAETRSGAAIALRARGGETVAHRLRVAAAATASPELRVALEKIADGAPDDEIARSIEKLR